MLEINEKKCITGNKEQLPKIHDKVLIQSMNLNQMNFSRTTPSSVLQLLLSIHSVGLEQSQYEATSLLPQIPTAGKWDPQYRLTLQISSYCSSLHANVDIVETIFIWRLKQGYIWRISPLTSTNFIYINTCLDCFPKYKHKNLFSVFGPFLLN